MQGFYWNYLRFFDSIQDLLIFKTSFSEIFKFEVCDLLRILEVD